MRLPSATRRRRAGLTRLTVAALAASLAGTPIAAGAAAQKATRYIAVSKTAYSITGNLTLKETGGLVRTIVFQNGKSLSLTGAGRDGVYLIVPAADPLLLNGNHLCGSGQRATRVALTWGIHDAFSLSVYSGKSMTDITLCGTFNYTAR
jgi:hypothetical protein